MDTFAISIIVLLIGAVLGYIVRRLVEAHERTNREKRIAYVFVVGLTQAFAWKTIADSLLDTAKTLPEYPKELAEESGRNVAFATYFVNSIKTEERDQSALQRIAQSCRESIARMQLTAEQKVLLPESTILKYAIFEHSLNTFEHYLLEVLLCEQTKVSDVANLIDSAYSLCDDAEKLRTEMAIYGKISNADIKKIDLRVLSPIAVSFFKQLSNYEALEALEQTDSPSDSSDTT